MMADLIDPRQREAAAILLAAVDLPAPAEQVAQTWLAAVVVCPGLTVSQVMLGDRSAQLNRVRDLVDAMLAEIQAPPEQKRRTPPPPIRPPHPRTPEDGRPIHTR